MMNELKVKEMARLKNDAHRTPTADFLGLGNPYEYGVRIAKKFANRYLGAQD
jgi:hypothetical protein